MVDLGQFKNLLTGHAQTERISQIPDPISAWHHQLLPDFFHGLRFAQINLAIKAVHAHFQATQRLLHRFLEGTTNSHHLTHRLHLGGQTGIGLWEFFEGKAWNFGDHVIDGWLERRRSHATGNIVLQLIEGIADRQLGSDLGNRKTGRFRSQRRGARDPWIHLNDDHTTINRIDTKLNVRTAGLDPDLTQYRQRGVTHQLVFPIGQSLGGSDGDGVTGVNTHGIEVFDRADNNAVVVLITHNLHLILFPTDQGFVDQQLIGGGEIKATGTNLFKLFLVVSDTATSTAHGKRGADNTWEANFVENLVSIFHVTGDTGSWAFEADVFHCLIEFAAIFRLVDSLCVGTDHFHAVLGQHTVLFQRQRTVQCGLTAHGWQDGIRTLFGDNFFHRLPADGFDVGSVGHGRIGHNSGRIRVHQNNPVTLFP